MTTVREELAKHVTQSMMSSFFIDKMGIINVKSYGAKGDGVTDDTAAIQSALTAAAASKGIVFFPPGTYLVSATLTWPQYVDIIGSGLFNTTIKTVNAITLVSASYAGPDYKQWGSMENISLQGANIGLIGLDVQYNYQMKLDHVFFGYFATNGAMINRTIMTKMSHCLFLGCGDATHGSLEVDYSTTFNWVSNYISGGQIGLMIDRTAFTIFNGAVESSGRVLLGSKSEASWPTGGTIIGLDIENPGNGNAYLEAGYGWTGTTGQGITGFELLNCSMPPATTTSIPYGIKIKHSDGAHFARNAIGQPGSPTAMIKLEGLTNLRMSITGLSSAVSYTYIEENGVERTDARPDHPWYQAGEHSVLGSKILTQNSTTPAINGYSYVKTNSTAATTITNMTGGIDGQVLYIFATDSNTTLQHNAGGAGQILTQAGVNLALTIAKAYCFIYDSSTTAWVQI